MKYTNGKRGLLQAVALGQVLLLVAAGCKSTVNNGVNPVAVTQALVGKDGARTINASNTIVNTYSALMADAAVGASSVTVNNIAELAANLGTDGGLQPLAVGDLLLIIQMRGATIDPNDPNDATWGNVPAANLGNAGNYELAGVAGISGNVITLGCALKKAYSGAIPTDAGVTVTRAQVVRVAQYTTLTINSGASIIASPWNGAVGGVVAVHAANTLQLNGSINVTGQGFHGGATHPGAAFPADSDQPTYRTSDGTLGAEKGESIAGWPNHDPLSIFPYPYGRGAPANGGGGGNWHNAAGGGGANAAASGESSDAGGANTWTGQGVMLSSVTGASAWLLDPGYALSGGPGGGRGGYTYSAANQNALDPTEAPGAANWGGNHRRERGGLGGRPVTSSPAGRLFLGGGGGAGDGNNGFPGAGGNGGGLVFVIAATVAGTGTISADGAPGGNANSAGNVSGDASGGGGGGGTVVVHAVSLSGIAVEANGGVGGSQVNINSAAEAEGPGGGGGGGYIALSGGAPRTVSASGGLGGTTSASTGVTSPLSEFPSNGATAGNTGVISGDATSILFCTDTVAPVTTIVTHPNDPTNGKRGDFTFASTGGVPATDGAVPADGTVTFQCKLDSATIYTTCSAAYTIPAPDLTDGQHTIYVHATDLSGNVGPDASFSWTVDTIAPDTFILTSPSDPSTSSSAHFTFSSNESGEAGEPGITFQCKLDTAAFAACPADYTINGLSDGSHTLQVAAQDPAGNLDASPDSYTWTVHALGSDGGAADAQEAGAEDASPGLDSADAIAISADAPATSPDVPELIVDAPATLVDAPVTVVPLDAAAVVDLAPIGGQDAPPIGNLDAAKDATTADGEGLLDAIIGGSGGDARAQDAQTVVVRDAGSIDAFAVPDQAVLPPDAQAVADAPVSVGPGPAAPVTPVNNHTFAVMGSGFCAVNPMRGSAPGFFTFFLLAGFGLVLRRRRR